MIKEYPQYKKCKSNWDEKYPINWKDIRGKSILNTKKEINKDNKWNNVLSLTLKGVVNNDIDNPLGLVPKDYNTYQFFKKNDLVFKLIDLQNISTSRVGLVHEDGIMSPAYIRLELKQNKNEEVNIKYIFYYYYSLWLRNIYNRLGDGVRQTLGAPELLNLNIPLPPKDEQNTIVDYLNYKTKQFNDFVSAKEKEIEKLNELRKTIINTAVTRGIRNAKLKDSNIDWIPQIPENWENINRKGLFTLRKQKALKTDKQLTASQHHGVIFQEDYMKITGNRIVVVMKDFDILKHVEAGDFVISMRSFQGGIEYSENSGSISSAYVMLKPNLELVYPKYFKWLLKSTLYITALQGTSDLVRDGQALRYSNFAKVRLLKVPMDEQKEIADYLDNVTKEIDLKIESINKQLELIKELKIKIISDVVIGKIDVRSEDISA